MIFKADCQESRGGGVKSFRPKRKRRSILSRAGSSINRGVNRVRRFFRR